MSTPDPDYDVFVEALRSPTCSDEHQRHMEQRLIARGILTVGSAGAVLATAAKVRAALGFAVKLGGAGQALGGLKLVVGGTVLVASIAATVPFMRQEQRAPKSVQRSAHPQVPIPAANPSVVVPPPSESPVIAQERPAQAPDGGDNLMLTKRRLPKHHRARTVTSDTLARENALLIKAAQHLHAGDPTRASHLLDQYDREFPRGVLGRERDLARERLRKLEFNRSER